MADEIRNDAANVGNNLAGSAREVAGNAEQGLGNVTDNAGMVQGGQQLTQSGAQERAGLTPGAAPSSAPSSAVPAHESLADAVEGLREDAGAQGRTLEQAEEQGVLEAGYDTDEPNPGFIGDHRDIDTSGQLWLSDDCCIRAVPTSGTASALIWTGTLWIPEKEKVMADNQNSNPNGSEDQTRPAGDWDKQYIAPPDASMGAQDTNTQGRAAGSAGSHEYGGSATDSRVSDSRNNATHQSDSGAEAGLMGSAYDTERQMQGGTPGSGANAPTSADMTGLNSSNGGATNSANATDNSVGGMLSSPTLGGAAPSGPAGSGASGGQLGDTMGRGSLQEGTVGGAMGSGAHGTSPTGGDLSGGQGMAGDTTGGTPALGDPTRASSMMASDQMGFDDDNAPNENAEYVTGHHYDNNFGVSGSMGGGVMQSDSMLGPQPNSGNATPASLNSAGAKPDKPQQGDDRTSMIGDHADSAGRHDNPYDQVRSADENETPETMGGLNGNSDEGDALEGQSHLYTPGTTEEDYPAT